MFRDVTLTRRPAQERLAARMASPLPTTAPATSVTPAANATFDELSRLTHDASALRQTDCHDAARARSTPDPPATAVHLLTAGPLGIS
jgi:hypothetical protein